MARKKTESAEKLIEIYQRAQRQLIKAIQDLPESWPRTQVYKKIILAQVNEILADLKRQTKKWSKSAIPLAYDAGVQNTKKELLKLKLDPDYEDQVLAATMSKIHKPAIEVIAQNFTDDMFGAIDYVGRNIYDQVRTIGLNITADHLTTGVTWKETRDAMLAQLEAEGITCLRDKLNRPMALDWYSALVARSTSREATNRGTMNTMTEAEEDLVMISEHAGSCGVCAQYQGRVFSIGGKSKDFPPLSAAFTPPYANIHPNCRHVITPWIPGLSGDYEEMRKYSNQPLVDNRSQADIDRYREEQKKNRERNRDKKEWAYYKTKFPDQTPKTFSGYRNAKKNKSKKYKELLKKERESRARGNQGIPVQKKKTTKKKAPAPKKAKAPPPAPAANLPQVKFSGLTPEVNQAVNKAHEELFEKGQKTGHEHAIILNFKGERIAEVTSKKESSLTFETNLLLSMMNSQDRFIVAHNHPGSSSFSADDIRLFATDGVNTIQHLSIVGHDKTVYTLSKTPQTGKILIDEIEDEYNYQQKDTYPKYQNKVQWGELDGKTAWIENSHEINSELASFFVLDYERHRP